MYSRDRKANLSRASGRSEHEDLAAQGGLLDQSAGHEQSGKVEQLVGPGIVLARQQRGLDKCEMAAQHAWQAARVDPTEEIAGRRVVALAIGQRALHQAVEPVGKRGLGQNGPHHRGLASAQHEQDRGTSIAGFAPGRRIRGQEPIRDMGHQLGLRRLGGLVAVRDLLLQGLQCADGREGRCRPANAGLAPRRRGQHGEPDGQNHD